MTNGDLFQECNVGLLYEKAIKVIQHTNRMKETKRHDHLN